MSKIKSYAAPQAGAELELYEYDAGELKAEDVEVQVDYCGICHSDLSMIDNEWGFSSYPLVAGHEVIGRVVALGSAAQDKGLKVGQRVGIGWTARSCGHCDACISGNQINCLEGAVPTILNKGGFADKLPPTGNGLSRYRTALISNPPVRCCVAASPSSSRC